MMKTLTCVVIGGGYAGIHSVKEIQKMGKNSGNAPRLRLILIDKNSYHTRKVLLFKPAVANEDITIPFSSMFPGGVEFVQANVTGIDTQSQRLVYQKTKDDKEQTLKYDLLVLGIGSVVRQPEANQGGIALTGVAEANDIKAAWRSNLQMAVRERNPKEKQRLMSIAVAGAGISGIETAAELAHHVREDARQLGLDPKEVAIRLFNAGERLFSDGPAKVGVKLEAALHSYGITVVHGSKVVQENKGKLTLSSGEVEPIGLCIWTLGLLPNPMLRTVGVPVTADGYVVVDESYRVKGAKGVYSIGDCAQIQDAASGRLDGKTCKEATAQAARLAKVIAADLAGRPAPVHKSFMDFYCFGLGPDRGMAWTRQWGIDMVFTGKLGWKMRKYSWDMASLLK